MAAFLALGFAWKGVQYLFQRRRAIAMRRCAWSAGLNYSGSVLTGDFPLDQCHFHKAVRCPRSIQNAVVGSLQGKDVVFFDWTTNCGDDEYAQTVVGVQCVPGAVWAARLDLSLTTEHPKGWTVLYRNHTLMSFGEIVALISSL